MQHLSEKKLGVNATQVSVTIVLVFVAGVLIVYRTNASDVPGSVDISLNSEFVRLSDGGNSSCMASFTDSIDTMADSEFLKGSCCSAMDMHRYAEQVQGLQAFKAVPGQNITEIPDDPYNINAGLAKRLKGYYGLELTESEQMAYDYAMTHSMEKGPCCCKCWRWYVYGGLAKYLITQHGFTGEQITQVWNLSDGCGGAGDHSGH